MSTKYHCSISWDIVLTLYRGNSWVEWILKKTALSHQSSLDNNTLRCHNESCSYQSHLHSSTLAVLHVTLSSRACPLSQGKLILRNPTLQNHCNQPLELIVKVKSIKSMLLTDCPLKINTINLVDGQSTYGNYPPLGSMVSQAWYRIVNSHIRYKIYHVQIRSNPISTRLMVSESKRAFFMTPRNIIHKGEET